MKLGVFGDSYAAGDIFHKGASWPRLVADKLNCSHDVFALGGSPLFYAYQHFIQNYHKYTHIVFVYTDYMRINTMPNHLMRYSNMLQADPEWLAKHFTEVYNEYKEELTCIIQSRKYTDNENFSKFVYQAIFDKVNSICKANNIKLVNIHPFEVKDRPVLDFSSRKATCLLNIFDVSANELGNNPYGNGMKGLKHPSFKGLITDRDIRPNHLNNHNNKELADIICSSFSNVGDPIDLSKHPRFSYDAEIVLGMLQDYYGEN